jgi:predicted HTH transcriptional regulator
MGLIAKLKQKLTTTEPPKWYQELEEQRKREYQELFNEISKIRDKIEDIYRILGVHSAEITNLKNKTENYGEVIERLNYLERELYKIEDHLKNFSAPEESQQSLDDQIITLLSKKPMTYSELKQRLNVSDRRLSQTLKELTDLSVVEKSRKGRKVYYRLRNPRGR